MTKRKLKQKIREGAIIQIGIFESKIVFARQFLLQLGIYNCLINKGDEIPSLDSIVESDIIFYCSVFNYVITSGNFEEVGYLPLNTEEINKVPPRFNQDVQSYNCTIFWSNGEQRDALPEECIGLEPNEVCDAEVLRQRIEDYFEGKRNFNVEFSKVILSPNDPRYIALASGRVLKWDLEKREFHVGDNNNLQ